MTTNNATPMVKQYQELKSQHPGTLLFFRLGDFYELFFDDAIVGARDLQITFTARHKERGNPIPMCGVPHHSAANYIAKLVRKGYREGPWGFLIALCAALYPILSYLKARLETSPEAAPHPASGEIKGPAQREGEEEKAPADTLEIE